MDDVHDSNLKTVNVGAKIKGDAFWGRCQNRGGRGGIDRCG